MNLIDMKIKQFLLVHLMQNTETNSCPIIYLFCRKRWILFPPEAGGLKPTRVPYEESSVYSELNFYCPNDLDAFNGKK